MRTIIKINLISLAIAALLPVTAPQAQSDSYPSKPSSLIVPTGAGGIIGTMAVAKAQPDGCYKNPEMKDADQHEYDWPAGGKIKGIVEGQRQVA